MGIRNLLPPAFVYAPVSLVYGDLPRAVVITGLRIWGLGWRRQYADAGPISLEDLLSLTGLSRSQLYQHLGQLASSDVLRYVREAGEFTFWFNKAGENVPEVRPKNRTPIVVSSFPDPDVSLSINGRQKKQQQVISSSGGESEGGRGESEKPDRDDSDFSDRLVVLDEMGVLEPTRSEVARLGWATVEYLQGWADWLEDRGLDVGVVVCNVRKEIQPPMSEEQVRRRRYEELGVMT